MFMESEFGCKMFLRFILLDPVQSVLIMHTPHIIFPHDVSCFHCSFMGVCILYNISVISVFVSRRNVICYLCKSGELLLMALQPDKKKKFFYEVLL